MFEVSVKEHGGYFHKPATREGRRGQEDRRESWVEWKWFQRTGARTHTDTHAHILYQYSPINMSILCFESGPLNPRRQQKAQETLEPFVPLVLTFVS